MTKLLTTPADKSKDLNDSTLNCALAYLGEVVGGYMVTVAGSFAQHDLALLGEGPADGGDEAESLVDGDKEEHAFAVVDGLLALAHVGVHGADQDAQQRADAKLGQDHLRVPQRIPG